MWRGIAERPKCMKLAGQVEQIKGNSVGLMDQSRAFDHPWIKRNLPHQSELGGIRKTTQFRNINQGGNVFREVRKYRPGVAEHRHAARMSVLHIEHGVVTRLLDDLSEVEIKHGVILAEQHHESDGVASDFVYHLAQRHEVPCALRHRDRLAIAQYLHELDKLDGERDGAIAQRR